MGTSAYATPSSSSADTSAPEPISARISAPLPKVAAAPTAAIDRTKAPSVEQLLDPSASPSLDGVDNTVLLASIADAVTAIYDRVFADSLVDLRTTLAKVPPPPETPFALEVLGFIVELVATAATAELGGLAIRAVTSRLGEPIGAALKEPLRSLTRRAGSAAGAGLIHGALGPTRARSEPQLGAHAAPGESLLDEYLTRQKQALVQHRLAALDTLRVVQATVARIDPGQLQSLVSTIEALAGDPHLSGWFRRKISMEWLNFCTRASLGPREEGQTTDVRGANQVGGIQPFPSPWPEHGAISIVIEAPSEVHGVDGLRLAKAMAPGNFGAATILQTAAEDRDAQDRPYTLATLPVFRTIRVTGDGGPLLDKMLMLISPEGNVEADIDSDILAAIGSGRSVSYEFSHETEIDHPTTPYGTVLHARRPADAMRGANVLIEWLRAFKPEVLT